MALANISGQPILWPSPLSATSMSSFQTLTIDAVGEKVAAIVLVPKTGNIRYVHYCTGTVGSGDPDVEIRLETVNQAVNPAAPSGTLVGTNTNITYVLDSTHDNTWERVQLTADASVTKGDPLAVVIVSTDTISIGIRYGNGGSQKFPYVSHYTTAWSAQAQPPVIVLEYSDGTFATIPWAWGFKNISFDDSTSSTLHRGFKMTPAFSFRACGIWQPSGPIDTGRTATYKIYGTDGTTVSASKAWDSDLQQQTGMVISYLLFDTPVEFTSGNTYWVAVTSDGTGTVRIYYIDFDSTSGLFDAMAPGGGKIVWSQATSPSGTGSWTDTARRVPLMGLLIDQLDAGGGGGGPVAARTLVQNIGTY